MKTSKFFISALAVAMLASCSDDDDSTPEIVNEEEVITTLNLTLSTMGADDIILTSRDLDGDGPDAPVITTSELPANTTFTGTIEVLNELEDPAEDITEEVAEEDDEHQFFYQAIGGADITVAYTDMDDDGNPVGINFTLTTGDASDGTMTVVLRHLLDKNADGVSDGNIENAGGDTDIEVSFPIAIQ